MYDRSGVRLSLVHTLPATAEANGVALAQVLSLGGLEPDALGDRDRIVRRSQIVAMMNGLARKSGNATIGLQMAAATDPTLLGPFGRSLLVGRTLGEALALQRRHMPWLQRGTSIRIETLGHTVRWSHRMLGCDPTEARLLHEGIAAFFVRFVRGATGDTTVRMHVILPHKPLAPLSVYEDALGCAVSFERGSDLVIRFDAALLGRSNLLRGVGEGTADVLTGPVVPADVDLADDHLLASLGRMIEVASLWGRFTLRDAAISIGLSPRSLQRRLQLLGTSFERLVDDWRRGEAQQLMADPSTGTTEIALRLGYTDPSHFIRAFRRWEGVSPTAFRHVLARNGN
jgi:AraC-like DNA-binding protein